MVRHTGINTPPPPPRSPSPQARDYTGALVYLDFARRGSEGEEEARLLMWVGYCAFHGGQFQRAFDAYQVGFNSATPIPPPHHNHDHIERHRRPGEANAQCPTAAATTTTTTTTPLRGP